MSKTMNRRKQEMVQVTDELAVSRRLYGVLERLADRVGAGSVDLFLRDELEASILGVRELRHMEMKASKAVELVHNGAFRDGGPDAVKVDLELDCSTYAKLRKLADGAGCGVDEFATCLFAAASAER